MSFRKLFPGLLVIFILAACQPTTTLQPTTTREPAADTSAATVELPAETAVLTTEVMTDTLTTTPEAMAGTSEVMTDTLTTTPEAMAGTSEVMTDTLTTTPEAMAGTSEAMTDTLTPTLEAMAGTAEATSAATTGTPKPAAAAGAGTPKPTEGTVMPAMGLREIPVKRVTIDVGVGSPIPVDVFVSGEWPDLCAQLAEIRQTATKNAFEITLMASELDPNCRSDQVGLLPFRIAIPLNVVELPEGTYTVTVNGVSTTLDMPLTQ